MKIKLDKAKKAAEDTRNITKNLEHLVETLSLLALAIFGFWGAYNVDLRTEYKYAVLLAACVVGVRGVWEFVKHLNRR